MVEVIKTELQTWDLWKQTGIQEKSAYLHYFPIGQYFIDPNYHCTCNIFFLFKSFFHYLFSFMCFFNFCFKEEWFQYKRAKSKHPSSTCLQKMLSQKEYSNNKDGRKGGREGEEEVKTGKEKRGKKEENEHD